MAMINISTVLLICRFFYSIDVVLTLSFWNSNIPAKFSSRFLCSSVPQYRLLMFPRVVHYLHQNVTKACFYNNGIISLETRFLFYKSFHRVQLSVGWFFLLQQDCRLSDSYLILFVCTPVFSECNYAFLSLDQGRILFRFYVS